jgi:hypothetical protein
LSFRGKVVGQEPDVRAHFCLHLAPAPAEDDAKKAFPAATILRSPTSKAFGSVKTGVGKCFLVSNRTGSRIGVARLSIRCDLKRRDESFERRSKVSCLQ